MVSALKKWIFTTLIMTASLLIIGILVISAQRPRLRPFSIIPIEQEPEISTDLSLNSIPFLKLLEFLGEKYEGETEVRYKFAEKKFINEDLEEEGFTLLTMFHLLSGVSKEYSSQSAEQLIARNTEFLQALQNNLNHPMIARAVLFYTDTDAMKVILRQNWPNVTKVVPYRLSHLVHMADFFRLASGPLLNQPVIACNGDIMLGENLELVDRKLMKERKVLFSLSRFGNNKVGNCDLQPYCTTHSFVGSHDTHIFSLMRPLQSNSLAQLDYPINLYRAENVMLAVMRDYEGFTVSNPCLLIKTYHIHCSQVRASRPGDQQALDQPYYNVKLSVYKNPTADLYYGGDTAGKFIKKYWILWCGIGILLISLVFYLIVNHRNTTK